MIRDWDDATLGRHERRVVVALAAALYGADVGAGAERDHERLADDVGRWLGAPAPATRGMLLALLVMLELSPVRFGFGLRTMSSLALRDRAAYLVALDASSSLALDVWKSVLGMARFSRPEAAAWTSAAIAPVASLVRGGAAKAAVTTNAERAGAERGFPSPSFARTRVAHEGRPS